MMPEWAWWIIGGYVVAWIGAIPTLWSFYTRRYPRDRDNLVVACFVAALWPAFFMSRIMRWLLG